MTDEPYLLNFASFRNILLQKLKHVPRLLRFFGITGLKMLGLYLYALIIGHKSGNILSILNKLKL